MKLEAELVAAALGVGSGLAAGPLERRLKGTKSTNFLKNPLGFEFVLEALESTIDGLSLFDDDLRNWLDKKN